MNSVKNWSFELGGKCLDAAWNESMMKAIWRIFLKKVSNFYKVSFKVLVAMLKNYDEEL